MGEARPHCALCSLTHSGGWPDVRVGDLIDGRYRVMAALGQGGFGKVFRAEDVHLRRQVALKLGHGDELLKGSELTFENEAAALAAIRHPNVVSVYAFGIVGPAPFFVMEHVAGASLQRILRAYREHGAHVPMHTALHVVQQLALGLGAAHAAGLVHRDVKPANVLIEEHTGRPVLVDFGIAMDAKRSIREVVGTAGYMPPEAATMGAHLGPASDLYSLACVAFELLTGALPFEGRPLAMRHAHLEAPRPLASKYRPQLAACDEVLARGMAVKPEARWSSCIAFADALADVIRAISLPHTEPKAIEITELVRPARRVLVVDDDPVAVKLLTRAAQIAFAGGEVAVARARTGPDAVANAERAMPALVVLDYHLPGIDGVEVLSRVRALPGGDRVAVLVASGTVSASERWRFSILGVQDFLDKPLDLVRISERIAMIARRQGWIIGTTAPTAGGGATTT